MYNIYKIINKKYAWYTYGALHISAYIKESRRQVTTKATYEPCSTNCQKQPSCKKVYGPQEGHCEKRCEIQSGSQEMAEMVG